MTALASIVKMRLCSIKNRARNVHKDSLAKIFVIIFGLGNVVGLGFWVSHESFRFIETFPAFGAALNAKMISLLFFALLILVILSTIIVTYTTIFITRETEFLFQYPVCPRTVFALKASEAMAFSSWASLFLCLPVLVAYGHLREASITYYLEMAVILSLFLLFAGLMGTTISVLVAPLIRRLRPRQLIAASGVLLTVLAWVFLRSFNFWDMDGENNLLILDRFTARLSALHSPYSPSHWASAAVLAAASGHHREVLFQGGTLLANTLIFLPLLSWYGKHLYGRQWISCHNQPVKQGRTRSRATGGGTAKPARPARSDAGVPLVSLALKDLKVFTRDPAQVSQSILFILLMVIYSLSLLRIPEFLTTGSLRMLVYFANLGAVCAILSSFTSRFIFPMLSLEGRAFWIVGLAPVSRSCILHEKAFFGLTVSLTLGLITATVSNAALRCPPLLFAGALYTVVLASVCLNSLATGLGAAYPSFEEDNPAKIAVGLGGALNFFASALSVAVLIALEALPYLLLGQDPGPWVFAAHGAALLFTAGLAAFCFRLGSRAMARREF